MDLFTSGVSNSSGPISWMNGMGRVYRMNEWCACNTHLWAGSDPHIQWHVCWHVAWLAHCGCRTQHEAWTNPVWAPHAARIPAVCIALGWSRARCLWHVGQISDLWAPPQVRLGSLGWIWPVDWVFATYLLLKQSNWYWSFTAFFNLWLLFVFFPKVFTVQDLLQLIRINPKSSLYKSLVNCFSLCNYCLSYNLWQNTLA